MNLESALACVPSIPAGVYRHFKGALYWVPGIVQLDEESGRFRVVYRSLETGVWWGREYENFVSRGRVVSAVVNNVQLDAFVVSDYPGRRYQRIGGFLLYVWLRIRYAWRGKPKDTR